MPESREHKWAAWSKLGLEGLPVPFWLFAAAATLAVFGEQMLEYAITNGGLGKLSTGFPFTRLVVPGLTLYMLVMLRVLRRSGVRELAALRPSIKIDDKAYDERVFQMVHMSPRREIGLLAASVAVVSIWFFVFNNPLPTASHIHLPADPILGGIFFTTFALFGWLGLNIVFSTIQFGQGLGELSRQPLVINVFDPTNLLPFGRMALVDSITAVGIILILLGGLGQPTELIDWLVIVLASAASILALILPLLGVHTQMKEAKTEMLQQVHRDLVRLHETIQSKQDFDPIEIGGLNSRIQALVTLRKTAVEAPNWPYQNTVTTSRALLVATSPLIYFVLTELIRVILTPVLGATP